MHLNKRKHPTKARSAACLILDSGQHGIVSIVEHIPEIAPRPKGDELLVVDFSQRDHHARHDMFVRQLLRVAEIFEFRSQKIGGNVASWLRSITAIECENIISMPLLYCSAQHFRIGPRQRSGKFASIKCPFPHRFGTSAGTSRAASADLIPGGGAASPRSSPLRMRNARRIAGLIRG